MVWWGPYACNWQRREQSGGHPRLVGGSLRVPHDELHDRRRVFQRMRMVAHSGLVDHLDVAPQLPVTCLEDRGVLRDRDYVVGVAHHVQQRNAGARQGLKTIDRIAAVVGKLLFGQSVALQPVGEKPVGGRALCLCAWPNCECHTRARRRRCTRPCRGSPPPNCRCTGRHGSCLPRPPGGPARSAWSVPGRRHSNAQRPRGYRTSRRHPYRPDGNRGPAGPGRPAARGRRIAPAKSRACPGRVPWASQGSTCVHRTGNRSGRNHSIDS